MQNLLIAFYTNPVKAPLPLFRYFQPQLSALINNLHKLVPVRIQAYFSTLNEQRSAQRCHSYVILLYIDVKVFRLKARSAQTIKSSLAAESFFAKKFGGK